MGFSLKIKTKNGDQHIIRWVNFMKNTKRLCNCSIYSDCNEETEIKFLKDKIQELTQIAPPLEIRSGFPPKVLTAADGDTLKKCGISSGGKIIATNSWPFLDVLQLLFVRF